MSRASGLEERATKLYADYMGHLFGCLPCQQEHYCPAGTRMRAAWKAAQAAASQAYRAGRPRTMPSGGGTR
ncbi:hypothetical protein GCM10012286_25810 [Streptomyces lasiicapitis]|uniref:Uncharacterized protein n=1 Tax=Streptomyces lasiicapitis TaxID=1923961 RepID=A0ABQ2LTH1_9ACTN|nr:hypothetical protein GCM10012286_25810 [Streptomyces lasiicapitis]